MNPPLREALETASQLAEEMLPPAPDLAAGETPLPTDQAAGETPSGKPEGQDEAGDRPQGNPNETAAKPPGTPATPSNRPAMDRQLGTGFVPNSPELTAQQIAGSQAQAEARERSGLRPTPSRRKSRAWRLARRLRRMRRSRRESKCGERVAASRRERGREAGEFHDDVGERKGSDGLDQVNGQGGEERQDADE